MIKQIVQGKLDIRISKGHIIYIFGGCIMPHFGCMVIFFFFFCISTVLAHNGEEACSPYNLIGPPRHIIHMNYTIKAGE